MRASLRSVWLSVRASYWFIPSILTIVAFALALTAVWFDRNGGSQWLTRFAWFEPSRPDGARAQLTVIAGGMISIASTVFAITIAAVAYASGNYGPRLLTNFMNDRGNQISLGVFIATFVYNLMVLRVVRNPQNGASTEAEAAAFVPQVSLLLSTASVLIAVAVLVYFLHHIPASIRINTVLGGIGRHLIRHIEDRFPLDGDTERPIPASEGEPVTATMVGYLKIVDFGDLDEIAKKHDLVISLRLRTGDFVHPHIVLAHTSGTPLDDHLRERIRSCFSLGDSRTSTQDVEFLIDELVEIALRALSPGINDPFTAITSIHWMGAALAKLSERRLGEGPEQHRYDTSRIRPVPDDFEHFLRRSFGGVRPSAASSRLAAGMFIEALANVATGPTTASRRASLLEEARQLVAQARFELEGPALEDVCDSLRAFEEKLARLP